MKRNNFALISFIVTFCFLQFVISCSSIEENLDSADATKDKQYDLVASNDEKTVGEDSLNENELKVLSIKLSEEIASRLEEGEITAKDFGAKSITPSFEIGGRFEQRQRKAGLHRWYRVEMDPELSLTKAAGGLLQIPGVEIAETIPGLELRANPVNDPYYSIQWGLYNDGERSTYHKSGIDINVLPVWQNYTMGSSDVIVAVIDGGIKTDHTELADAYLKGYNFVKSNSTIVAHEHGTHVAGIIGATTNNAKGIAGVAGGNAAIGQKGVRLLSAQIFEPNPSNPEKDLSSSNTHSAIVWAADNGAVIANNSWGYSFKTKQEAAAATIGGELKAAIDYFIKYAGCDEFGAQLPNSPMAGGIVFFAAGNSGWDVDPICAYEPVISVGAVAPNGNRASYSNYGSWVDICAPGGESYGENGPTSTYIISTSAASTTSYIYMAGTSMACPYVSGVAALILSYYGGQGYTNEMLKERLMNGANAEITDGQNIGPLVNAAASFRYNSGGIQNQKPVIQIVDNDTNEEYTGDTLRIYSFGEKSFKVSVSDPDGDRFVFKFIAGTSGDTYEMVSEGNYLVNIKPKYAEEGKYEIGLTATDQYGLVGSRKILYNIMPNTPPVVKKVLEGILLTSMDDVFVVDPTEYFYDADGEPLNLRLIFNDESIASYQKKNGKILITPLKYGSTTVKLFVKDSSGEIASQDVKLIVKDKSQLLELYPNPVRDYVFIRTGQNLSTKVTVQTSYGRIVKQFVAEIGVFNPYKLDLSDLPFGHYIITTENSDFTTSKQIVKL